MAILARAEALPSVEFGHTDERRWIELSANALTKLEKVEVALVVQT
ncbi:hypothetical protein JZ785_16835 [Alicyclobacillus curvatus]|nr:hypothetical protein JZ785_16835 [Alicyclobacillus curvatus]